MSDKPHSLVIVTRAGINVLTYEDKLAAEMAFDNVADCLADGNMFRFRSERLLIQSDGLLSMHVCEGTGPTEDRN
jgi:hypothetical protein